jgi:hypothetical protein
VLLPLYHGRQEESDGSVLWVKATAQAATDWHGPPSSGSARLWQALCAWHVATESAVLAAHGERIAPATETGTGFSLRECE